MGGGARTAYQVGVLRALASMLARQAPAAQTFPFQVLIGTSAGALNASFLAGCATHGLQAFDLLADFWSAIRSTDVYRLQLSPWARVNKFAAALSLSSNARASGAILDNMPLVDTLHRAVSLPGIDKALATGVLDALAVTASSYTSGVHWTFCHTAQDSPVDAWARPGRRSEFNAITIEHLMASSAIPFLFPATPLWVDGHKEFFGDGSMRQVSPLSPAMHLGAKKVLVVGANNSAVDAALETWRKGAEVTMVIRNEVIGSRVKYWVRPDIENRIKELHELQIDRTSCSDFWANQFRVLLELDPQYQKHADGLDPGRHQLRPDDRRRRRRHAAHGRVPRRLRLGDDRRRQQPPPPAGFGHRCPRDRG